MTAIDVHVDLGGATVDVGYATITTRGALGPQTRFVYDRDYIARPDA